MHTDDDEVLALKVKFRELKRTLLPHGVLRYTPYASVWWQLYLTGNILRPLVPGTFPITKP